jgi:hypothetical protein
MAKLAIDVVLNKAAAMTGLRGMEKDITSFGKAALGLAGLGGGLAGFVAGIDNILAKAGQLQDVSDAFNISAESIQRLAAVGVTANLSIEEIGSKLGKLGKAAQEAAGGNTELAKTFAKIGVTGQDLVSLNPEQLFNKLRIAVSSGALAGEELKVVNELLAKDFQRFLPILRMTSEEFERLGGSSAVMSDAMVSSLDAANVSLRTFQNGFSQGAALLTGTFLDMVAVFKENPLLLIDPEVTNLTKALKDREEKIKKAIADERKMRAGMEKSVVDEKKIEDENKAFEKSEQAAAKHELKLIESQISGKEEAEKMKAAIEEKYRQRSLDRERDMANRKAELMPQIEDLQAQRQGSGAEMKLLEERAAAASAQARISGGAEDVFNAQKLAVELQKSKEQAFNQAGFGDQSFSRAKASTEAIVGAIPQASQLRDIPSSTEAQRTQPVKLENPPDLQGIMDKLDSLIKNAGVFS